MLRVFMVITVVLVVPRLLVAAVRPSLIPMFRLGRTPLQHLIECTTLLPCGGVVVSITRLFRRLSVLQMAILQLCPVVM